MLAGFMVARPIAAQSGGGYVLETATVSAGAVTSSGAGNLDVRGTLAQPDALRATGGSYDVAGGIWPIVAGGPLTDVLFRNGLDH